MGFFSREAKGTPRGGRFAATRRPEANVSLDAHPYLGKPATQDDLARAEWQAYDDGKARLSER